MTEFSFGVSAKAIPNLIAAGPDGNLWFTELGLSRIGRITPSGAVSEYPHPARPAACAGYHWALRRNATQFARASKAAKAATTERERRLARVRVHRLTTTRTRLIHLQARACRLV